MIFKTYSSIRVHYSNTMGRKSKEFIRELYVQKGDKNICKKCSNVINGNYITNLERHLKSKHGQFFNKMLENNNANCTQCEKKVKISVEFSEKEVLANIVDLVAKENIPFATLDCQSFRFFVQPIFNGLGMDVVNAHNIFKILSARQSHLKQGIIKTLKQRLLCLKIDTVSCEGRGILGINVQFVKNAKITIKTLDMVELKRSHTADYIAETIKNVLAEYEIRISQIYTVTTDNGRNMVKAVDFLRSQIENCSENEEANEETSFENIELDTWDGVHSIRCAAHTMQLAVWDLLKISPIRTIIEKMRNLSKTLRTPTNRQLLKTYTNLAPKLDMPTRWNSTYQMLKRITDLRPYVSEIPDTERLEISDHDWRALNELQASFKLLNDATLRFQGEQMAFGDFFKIWLETKIEIGSLEGDIAAKTKALLEKREKALFDNEVINAAIYLDPRFNKILSGEAKIAALKHIKSLIVKLHELKKGRIDISATQSSSDMENTNTLPQTNQSTNKTKLEQYLEKFTERSSGESEEGEEYIHRCFDEAKSFNKNKSKMDINILKYWQDSVIYTYLGEIGQIVHGVPATQVSVERAFSALKIILNNRRTALTEARLKDLILIKLNS